MTEFRCRFVEDEWICDVYLSGWYYERQTFKDPADMINFIEGYKPPENFKTDQDEMIKQG